MYDTSILFFIAERGWWKFFFASLVTFLKGLLTYKTLSLFFLPTLVKLWLSRL